MTTAVQLKDEGNKLYVARDYTSAYIKYSQAIELDASAAMFWANRAACLLAMKRYTDAASDCKEAVKIDPGYTKAWMRLGSALSNTGAYPESIDAYKKAQATIPKENLTQEHKNLARQCDLELRAVYERKLKPADLVYAKKTKDQELPWVRAQQILDKVESDSSAPDVTRSSAWVISEAYKEFKEGVDMILSVRVKRNARGQSTRVEGMYNGLKALSNGILRDQRAFHIADSRFIEKYNTQVYMESQRDNAYQEADVQGGIEHFLKLKQQGGWLAVQPSVATTIRAWIMRGFMELGLRNNIDASMELYNSAIEILEWGRQVWRDESKENRGCVFERSFVRGVKRLRLDALIKATVADPDRYPLDDMYEAAQELIKDVESDTRPDGVDPGFISSFWVYPMGQAYSVIALYYRQLAKLHRKEPELFAKYLEECSTAYVQAAMEYPPDDEFHATFLNSALEISYFRRATVGEVLPIFRLLHISTPLMMHIWEFSGTMMHANRGFESMLVKMLMRGDALLTDLENGKVTKEDRVSWDEVFQ